MALDILESKIDEEIVLEVIDVKNDKITLKDITNEIKRDIFCYIKNKDKKLYLKLLRKSK